MEFTFENLLSEHRLTAQIDALREERASLSMKVNQGRVKSGTVVPIDNREVHSHLIYAKY